jgi:hypothetical protein
VEIPNFCQFLKISSSMFWLLGAFFHVCFAMLHPIVYWLFSNYLLFINCRKTLSSQALSSRNTSSITSKSSNNLVTSLGEQPMSPITSLAVTRVAVSSSSSPKRIQCDQCARKCVDKKDMECHIFLWHTTWRNTNPRKEADF